MHIWTNINVLTGLILILLISFSNSHPTKPSEECEPELNHPKLWKKVVKKGRELQKQMDANSQPADQTSFTHYSDLETYGWTETPLEMSEVEGSDNDLLKKLGIDDSNSKYISLDQDTETTVDNIKYGVRAIRDHTRQNILYSRSNSQALRKLVASIEASSVHRTGRWWQSTM